MVIKVHSNLNANSVANEFQAGLEACWVNEAR